MAAPDPDEIEVHEIEELDLRTVFAREDSTFTPWLSRPQNLSRLSAALGMELELVGTELSTGAFRTDILARSVSDGGAVVIENQFGRSDHDHRGKALTYLAAHDARAVVWVAERFADEHRAALDWLNDQTPEHVGFFGVVPRLLRIGGSPPGLEFDVAVRPNALVKAVRAEGRALDLHQDLRGAFWTELQAEMAKSAPFNPAARGTGGGRRSCG